MALLLVRFAPYAIVAVLAFGAGWKVNSWRHDAIEFAQMESDAQAMQAAAERERRIVELRKANIESAAQVALERARQAKVVERIVTNDVIKYVQTPAAAQCALDADGVRIINTSAGLPALPDASGAPNDGARAATAARIVASVTDNYQTCHANADQLRALQDWVRAANTQ